MLHIWYRELQSNMVQNQSQAFTTLDRGPQMFLRDLGTQSIISAWTLAQGPQTFLLSVHSYSL